MKEVWKFTLSPHLISDKQVIEMPIHTEIVSMQVQDGTPCMWGIVETEWPVENVEFMIVGTGWKLPKFEKFIGTYQEGTFVWHIFKLDK